MRKASEVLFTCTVLLLGWHSVPLHCQKASINPAAAACGSTPANYTVRHDTAPFVPIPVPPGKALIYVIESMPSDIIATSKVNIGLDGAWLGATEAQTHISFPVDPGVHHLCAVYQGHIASMDAEGQTLLLHLDVMAGHTYYFRYHAFFPKDPRGVAFFEPVDEDEGQLLLARTEAATSTLKR